MNIKLNCGREVSIDGFSMGYTYAPLLEGRINERMNNTLFDWVKPPNNWGDTKIFKIRPEEIDFKNRLQPIHFSVKLMGKTPIDPEFDNSRLIVVWLADFSLEKTILEIIQDGLKDFDWESNAEDFEYNF